MAPIALRRGGLLLAILANVAGMADAQTQAVSGALRRQIDQAMDRGHRALAVGRLADLATGAERRSDGLCLYAALHAGASRYGEQVHAASESLAKQRIRRTYEAACAIMALCLSDAGAYRSSIARHVAFLERTQTQGVRGYPGSADLSNTQYAAFGLWTAHKHGFPVDREVWAKLAAALPDFQTAEGGFGYSRDAGHATVAMTAAGIACAEICLRLFDGESGPGSLWREGELHGLRVMEARALEWMADTFEDGRGPMSGMKRGFPTTRSTERNELPSAPAPSDSVRTTGTRKVP